VNSSVRHTLLVMLTSGLALAACGGDDGPVLHVYSGRHYGVERAFERYEDDTGVNVEFLTGNDGELRERIVAEGDETEADVYLTVDAGNLAAAAAQGVFQPLDSPAIAAAIPAELRDPDNLWFGLAVRTRSIVYTADESRLAAADVPQTYAELADPEWQGRVCLRRSADAYQQSLVASLIARDGYDATLETVRGWAANAEIIANDVTLLETIAAGGCDVGIANHYYLAREYADDPDFPVLLTWADQDGNGVHVNVSGGGVTAHADQPELAQEFLEWLATDGQEVFVGDNYEYPANPAIEPDPLLAERFDTDVVRDHLNAAEMGALNPDAVRLMDEAGYG
jgi:iron(III) transport system substrate-binding protein